MKLYVEEKIKANKTGKILYLDKNALTRKDLHRLLGEKEFYIKDQKYHIDQVRAKKTSENTALGMVLGGVLGLVGGTAGVVAGGTIGALFGKDSDIKEDQKIKKFNGSKL